MVNVNGERQWISPKHILYKSTPNLSDSLPYRTERYNCQCVISVVCSCVCVQGASQGDLAETFQKVAGFYIHFQDEKVWLICMSLNDK
jgi:hypothetical protein